MSVEGEGGGRKYRARKRDESESGGENEKEDGPSNNKVPKTDDNNRSGHAQSSSVSLAAASFFAPLSLLRAAQRLGLMLLFFVCSLKKMFRNVHYQRFQQGP